MLALCERADGLREAGKRLFCAELKRQWFSPERGWSTGLAGAVNSVLVPLVSEELVPTKGTESTPYSGEGTMSYERRDDGFYVGWGADFTRDWGERRKVTGEGLFRLGGSMALPSRSTWTSGMSASRHYQRNTGPQHPALEQPQTVWRQEGGMAPSASAAKWVGSCIGSRDLRDATVLLVISAGGS